jgi:hypothetical protein
MELEQSTRVEQSASDEHHTVYQGIDEVGHVNQLHGATSDGSLCRGDFTQSGAGRVVIHQGTSQTTLLIFAIMTPTTTPPYTLRFVELKHRYDRDSEMRASTLCWFACFRTT